MSAAGMKHDGVDWSLMWSGVALLIRSRWYRRCEGVSHGTWNSSTMFRLK